MLHWCRKRVPPCYVPAGLTPIPSSYCTVEYSSVRRSQQTPDWLESDGPGGVASSVCVTTVEICTPLSSSLPPSLSRARSLSPSLCSLFRARRCQSEEEKAARQKALAGKNLYCLFKSILGAVRPSHCEYICGYTLPSIYTSMSARSVTSVKLPLAGLFRHGKYRYY